MKIVLVNHQNANDINSFSGTSYFMRRALKAQFEEVIEYNSMESSYTYKQVYEDGIKKILQPIGEKLSDFLKQNDIKADYIIFQGGNSSLPYYNYDIPVVFWHDSTWHTYLHGYANTKQFEDFKIDYENLYLWDKAALDKCDLLVYSSDYVAEACIRNYNITPDKVKVIPFGANIFQSPSSDLLTKALEDRLNNNSLVLTFLGKDWKRKGLYSAYQLAERLNLSGIKTTLNIIGCDPDIKEINNSPFVINWGFIDKSNKDELNLFEKIFKETHFLVHPANAEPFGIALCEANAYGIPILGTAVEGLKTIIVNGHNGYLFGVGSFVSDAVAIVKQLKGNFRENYTNLFKNSLNEYNERLNWESSVTELKKILI